MKNSTLAEGVRARHHSYIGDAEIGRNVNVGAGSITANFDGLKVNRTTVGDDCYVGSGAVLIAPLVLKERSHVGPGTVVSQEDADLLEQKALPREVDS